MGEIRQSQVNKELEGKISPEDIVEASKIAKDSAEQTRLTFDLITGSHCENCPVKDKSMSVLPQGAVNSPVMIIGGQPGEYDEYSRTPFFDPAGRLFTLMLAKMGIDRRLIYLTNGSKCRNDFSQVPEVTYQCFIHYLGREIQMIRPKIVLVLGKESSMVAHDIFLSNPGADLESLRGKRFNVRHGDIDFEMYHTYDPAFVLSKTGTMYAKYKNELWKDTYAFFARAKTLSPNYAFKQN